MNLTLRYRKIVGHFRLKNVDSDKKTRQNPQGQIPTYQNKSRLKQNKIYLLKYNKNRAKRFKHSYL